MVEKKMQHGNSMKKNIILNTLKTAMGFLFPLITFPYVSRVLGTVGLGKVNFSHSIISYFALAASLGVISYGIREGAALKNRIKERDAFFNEVFSVNFISLIVSFLILLVVLFTCIRLQEYNTIILVQSLSMFFAWIGVEWIFYIYEDYFQITLRFLIAQFLSIILMFVFVKTPDDYIIYALVTVLANGGSFIFNYIYAGKYYRPRLTLNCNVKKHLVPMTILASNSFAITIYVNSDVTMIGFFLNDHYVGLYSTAVKVYYIVKHVMAAIIASATSRVSYYYHNAELDKYEKLVTQMAQVLLVVALPAMVGLLMTNDDIIYVIAGDQYIESAPVLAVLSFALLFATFGSFAATYGLIIRRKDKVLLKHTTISALLNVGLNFFMIPVFGIIGAAITTLISELYVCIVFLLIVNFNDLIKKCAHTICTCLISCIMIFGTCILMKQLPNPYIRLFLTIASCTLLHAFICFLRKETIVLSLIKKRKT